MRSRRQVHSRSGGQRRKLVWSTVSTTVTFTAVTQVSTTDLLAPLEVAGASKLGCTVIRTHLQVYDLSTVAGGDRTALGLIVANSALVGLGVAGANDPTANPELDWYFLDKRSATAINANAQLGNVGTTNCMAYDIRAKRKVEELGDTATLAIRLPTHGTLPASYDIYCRTLIALP